MMTTMDGATDDDDADLNFKCDSDSYDVDDDARRDWAARDGGGAVGIMLRALMGRVAALEGKNAALRGALETSERAREDALEALERARRTGAVVARASASDDAVAASRVATAAVVTAIGSPGRTPPSSSSSSSSRRIVWSHAAESMYTPDAVVLSPSAGKAFMADADAVVTTPISIVRRVCMRDVEEVSDEPLEAAFAKIDVSPAGPFDVLCDSSREHDATFESHADDDALHHARRSPSAAARAMYESESVASDAEADGSGVADENASPTSEHRIQWDDAPTTPACAKLCAPKTPMAPLRHQNFRAKVPRESSRASAEADRPSAKCVSPRILF